MPAMTSAGMKAMQISSLGVVSLGWRFEGLSSSVMET
jgi:hypothetical protein